MQKKKRMKRMIVLGSFYLTGLAIGIILMMTIPYFSHRQELINMAAEAAENYSQEQDFGIVAHFGMNYLAFDLEGNCISKVVSGYSDMEFHIDTDKYLKRIEKRETALYYDRIEIIMQSVSRRQLSLIAAAPIRSGNDLTGIFFLVRELQEVSTNLKIFILVWSFMFILLFLFFYIVDRKETELEQLQRTYIASMNRRFPAGFVIVY